MRYKLVLSYRGTNYHGWQIQPNAKTVQKTLNDALSLVLRENIATMGSGRTDTGVHATMQVVHFNCSDTIPENLCHKLNNYLPRDIAINSVEKTSETFHARYDATSRLYRYCIHSSKSPFKNNLSYQFSKKLNIYQMNEACLLLKEHSDFECFSKVKTEVTNFHCAIMEAYWKKNNEDLVFYIKANRFLRNMVRAIVGTLLEVGLGNCSLENFDSILKSKNRAKAGASAPAHGLYLEEVNY